MVARDRLAMRRHASVDEGATLPAMENASKPIDDETFEDWVLEAIDTLPPAFRDRLGSVAIVIEEWPTAAQLESVGAAGLFGLYQGVPRSVPGADHSVTPSKITIYRGTLERFYRTPEALRAKVIDTVHHEIGHHFGISDARLYELAGEREHGTGGHGH
jgi:predicted Zn-dependent protease with MMP-like domain